MIAEILALPYCQPCIKSCSKHVFVFIIVQLSFVCYFVSILSSFFPQNFSTSFSGSLSCPSLRRDQGRVGENEKDIQVGTSLISLLLFTFDPLSFRVTVFFELCPQIFFFFAPPYWHKNRKRENKKDDLIKLFSPEKVDQFIRGGSLCQFIRNYNLIWSEIRSFIPGHFCPSLQKKSSKD